MRILTVHNFYLQPGGEDAVFKAESDLLEERGHEVTRFTVSNKDVTTFSSLALAGATLWNHAAYHSLSELFRDNRPDVVHIHNTVPLISPSIYYAARAENIPVVQMMHNYRPFCLNGVLFRDGKVCEDCVGTYPIPGIIHKCYRDSTSASAAIFALYTTHFKLLRTYQRHISVCIASTQFAKGLFMKMGLDGEKFMVKPNLVPLADIPSIRGSSAINSKHAVYVGRLDTRKGIWTLLRAVEKVNLSLTLVGDGELRSDVETWLQNRPYLRVELTGWLSSSEVSRHLERASVLILPSEFYESFGNVIVEAFAHGLPVVTTNIGAQSELVEDGNTGFLFSPGDVEALVRILVTLNQDPSLGRFLGENARREYLAKYTPDRIYQSLMKIYHRATQDNIK